jgi:predicted CoA-binding protein
VIEPDDAAIRDLLVRARLIAVVGLSPDSSRPSYGVASYLQRVGYEIVPVNPKYPGELILGVATVAILSEIESHIDIVDLFRRSVDVPRPAREAISVRAGSIWMQLGIRNEPIAEEASAAGLTVVQDRCIAIEHRRLLNRSS